MVDLTDGNGNREDESAAPNGNDAPSPYTYTEPHVIIHKSESSSTDSQNSEYYKEERLLRSTDSESGSSVCAGSSDEMMTSLESGVKTIIYESVNSQEAGSTNPAENISSKDEGKKNKCIIT